MHIFPLRRSAELKPLPTLCEGPTTPSTGGVRSDSTSGGPLYHAAAQRHAIPVLEKEVPPVKVRLKGAVQTYPMIELLWHGGQIDHLPENCPAARTTRQACCSWPMRDRSSRFRQPFRHRQLAIRRPSFERAAGYPGRKVWTMGSPPCAR